MTITQVELKIGNKTLTLETGRMARQSDGAVVVTVGDTVVLSTAVGDKKPKPLLDFFPLTIDYQEKAYAAGKIPGGFFKREGKPSEKEVLTSRLIDRPLRPLFPDGYCSETQGIAAVLSFGRENISDILGVIGMSAALMISDIPFEGPVGAVKVGMLDGNLIVNPDIEQSENLEMNLIVAGTETAVVMVEGGALEASEESLLKAINFAHVEIKRICALQRELAAKVGRPKRKLIEKVVDQAFIKDVENFVSSRINEDVKIPGKLRRQVALEDLLAEAIAHFNTPEKDRTKEIATAFYGYEKRIVRDMIVKDNVRADGRKPGEIRQINSFVGILPRTHGSALFVRGETQALAITTLGTADDEQKIDALEGQTYKNFMLHYNFLPFSVGEVKFLRSPGRREIGHGALAERAIRAVMPTKEEFPYTIRIVSDILESNGSSSMATVCGASLSLMDAGVPVKAPVAGIAMGLIVDGDRAIILKDILGLEDHLGDMDFKVAGTAKGITAFQMDVKTGGISMSVMETALAQAKEGRLHILGEMAKTLTEPKGALSMHAPRIYTMQIKTEKIKDVIGTGGKVIRGIIEQCGVKINVNDSGVVTIASVDGESAQKAIDIIKGIVAEAEMGKIYFGKVKRVVDFGAFVEIMPGTEGLVHISQIAEKRILKVTDEINEGDDVYVKVIESDKTGKIRLSRKEAMQDMAKGKS